MIELALKQLSKDAFGEYCDHCGIYNVACYSEWGTLLEKECYHCHHSLTYEKPYEKRPATHILGEPIDYIESIELSPGIVTWGFIPFRFYDSAIHVLSYHPQRHD